MKKLIYISIFGLILTSCTYSHKEIATIATLNCLDNNWDTIEVNCNIDYLFINDDYYKIPQLRDGLERKTIKFNACDFKILKRNEKEESK